MNNLKIHSRFIILTVLTLFVISVTAQTRDQKKKSEIKRLIESRNFVFSPQSVTPLSGSTFQLTSEYFLEVNKDSLDSHLPYFGVAFNARFGSTDSPLTFTSTDFDYSIKESKKGGFEITISINKPDDPDLILLSVSSGGYATLRVNSMNRQSISFYGEIEAPIPPKKK
ncbi:protein of unknown function [Daejeonella rubra]|uniref:DUF4251 domain-containing protein n=1 Tax=Daejeonella rubra TaxID=990371 RepID=A0A1G9YQ82_9SPHI|nr:DUF4251 domain-containing protein [Daejeonella rubra]SDN10586.1 protein of unknown function [Daejeonella rubra]